MEFWTQESIVRRPAVAWTVKCTGRASHERVKHTQLCSPSTLSSTVPSTDPRPPHCDGDAARQQLPRPLDHTVCFMQWSPHAGQRSGLAPARKRHTASPSPHPCQQPNGHSTRSRPKPASPDCRCAADILAVTPPSVVSVSVAIRHRFIAVKFPTNPPCKQSPPCSFTPVAPSMTFMSGHIVCVFVIDRLSPTASTGPRQQPPGSALPGRILPGSSLPGSSLPPRQHPPRFFAPLPCTACRRLTPCRTASPTYPKGSPSSLSSPFTAFLLHSLRTRKPHRTRTEPLHCRRPAIQTSHQRSYTHIYTPTPALPPNRPPLPLHPHSCYSSYASVGAVQPTAARHVPMAAARRRSGSRPMAANWARICTTQRGGTGKATARTGQGKAEFGNGGRGSQAGWRVNALVGLWWRRQAGSGAELEMA